MTTAAPDDAPIARRLTVCFRGVTWALGLCTLAGFLGAYGWWLDLFDHFRVHGMVSGLLLGSVAFVSHRRHIALAALTLALINGLAMSRTHPGAARSGGVPILDALVFNVHSIGDPEAVSRLLDNEQSTAVVGLLEVTPDWVERLETALTPWPYRVVVPRHDNFGLLLASRWPLSRSSRATNVGGVPIIDATVTPPNAAPVDFLLVHPPPPMSARATAIRNESVRAYAKQRRRHRDGILAGDFNATLWSRALAPLATAGYGSVRRDWGTVATWPTAYGPLGIAIDHAFVRGDLTAIDFEVLGDAGSDHRPIRFTVGRP